MKVKLEIELLVALKIGVGEGNEPDKMPENKLELVGVVSPITTISIRRRQAANKIYFLIVSICVQAIKPMKNPANPL